MKNFLKIFFLIAMIFSKNTNAKTQKAILSGGCFWGMEELLRNFDGVTETNVGYIGDDIENPTYEIVSSHLTKFVEAVEVSFDENKTSYEKILKFFFTIHDPTTLDKQGNDIGYSYSSNIFYLNEKQKEIALSVIAKGNESGVFDGPIVTRVLKAKKFWPAENYHQDYLQKNPFGYTCHHARSEWKF